MISNIRIWEDSIKIIDVDGYEEIRKVKQSGKELLRQKNSPLIDVDQE